MIIAHNVSQQYRDKHEFYVNLKNFLNQFKINVSFKKESLIEFINKKPCKKQFKSLLDAYKDYLFTNELDLSKITLLDDYEKEDLSNILKNLGSYNSENEVAQLNSFLTVIEEKINMALLDKNKLCPMILKLSLLFSLALAIILI